jgi:Mce-associated membrane protein
MSREETTVRVPAPAPEKKPADPEAPRRPDRVRLLRVLRALRGTPLLLIVAVLLAIAGTLLRAATVHMRGDDAVTNRAVTDAAGTQAALTEVGRAVETIFSYSYRDPAATERAAGDLLAGSAATEYQRLFAQVTAHAPEQRLTLTTRVAAAGVGELREDRATVLLFLDQSYTYGDGRPARTAAAQLSVTAQRDGQRWRITDIDTR